MCFVGSMLSMTGIHVFDVKVHGMGRLLKPFFDRIVDLFFPGETLVVGEEEQNLFWRKGIFVLPRAMGLRETGRLDGNIRRNGVGNTWHVFDCMA